MAVFALVLEYLKVLIWPSVTILIVLLFRPQLTKLLTHIRHAELPGGVKVDIGEDVEEVKNLTEQLQSNETSSGLSRAQEGKGTPSIATAEANSTLIHAGLRPSPSGLDMHYYGHWASRDPSVALAGLRVELEIIARNLSKAFRVSTDDKIAGHRLIQRLRDADVLSFEQSQLFHKVYRVCSAAAHGAEVTPDEAAEIIDATQVLADQYLTIIGRHIKDS